MARFDFSKYSMVLLRVYDAVPEETERLVDDLDYYFYEEVDKHKQLYLVSKGETDIYIIYKIGSTWNTEKLNLIIGNSLKKTTFMSIQIDWYYGIMLKSFWSELKECEEFFKNPKAYRKKIEDEEDEILIAKEITIDDVLNKINKSGMESLSDEEQDILKNQNQK